MSYSNSAILLDLEGGSLTSDATARLWMVWKVIGFGSGIGDQQSEEESMDGTIKHDDSTPMPINFNKNADFSYASRSVGLSIQEKALVGNNIGWLFRSSGFSMSLPTQPIEIVIGKQVITSSEFTSMLPATPFTADANTIITAFTASLAQGGIHFTATGTTKKTGVIVGFTYSGMMVLSPSADIQNADIEALTVLVSNPSITFTSGPGVLSAVEAELMNLLNVFIMKDNGPQICATIGRRINSGLIAAAGRQLAGGTLPAGIILSIRSISVTSANINAEAALGAFGGVFSKLPQTSTPSKCFIATATFGNGSPEVQTLRTFRDVFLLTNRVGSKFVRLYEFISPGIAHRISKQPFLKWMVRICIVKPSFNVAKVIILLHSKRK
jgi:hypothetical protein